jgi:hypothetical protein
VYHLKGDKKMHFKNFIKSCFLLILLAAIIVTSFPVTSAAAKTKTNNSNWHNQYYGCTEPNDNATAKNFLVLIGQSNGTYIAYNNIAFVTDKDKLMVKAKPLAEALGLTYKNSNGYWGKKGFTLTLDKKKNVYTKNSKTYYFYDYSSNSKRPWVDKLTAQYKQMVYQNDNAVHYATLSTLVYFQYYDTSYTLDYSNLGYRGVVVYSRYNTISNLPSLSLVGNLQGNPNTPSNDVTVNLRPDIITNGSYSDIKYVEANYYTLQSTGSLILNLTDVLSTFQAYALPYDGVYGYGSCDTAVTIQGLDKNGYTVGEIKTTGNEFLIAFPTASKLKIIGATKNLSLDFTPVRPIVITDTAKLSFNQISWLYPSDHYARQYFVLSEYLRFYPENISQPFALSRKLLDINCKDDPDVANSYQRITAVFRSPYNEMTSPNCFINVQRTKKAINNSLVVFNDTGNAVLASNYESQLNSMITTLKNSSLNTYFPNKNWDRQLVMKLPDNIVNTAYTYITIDPSALNLDYFYDYYLHLHEMTHFYEATQLHYGFRFEAWSEGNATTLAIKAMDNLKISHVDAQGKNYFDSLFATNYDFLTQDNKNNFEAYYLNATGWNATLIGYHFNNFLRDIYGADTVYRILEKVYASNIPTGAGRNSTYDKLFTDCIKSATSQKVFQLFVEYCVD